MGDPVTMAMIGAGVGAITNPKKPLQGALLGGALGGFGGAAVTGFKAAGAAGTAGLAGAGGSGMGAAGTLTNAGAGGASAYYPVTQVASPANPLMPMGQSAIGTTPTFMEQIKGGLQGLGQFGKENPMVGQVGMKAFESLNEPMAAAPQAGLLRGTPSAIEQPQVAMFQPKPISLI
jgi:hypothetical protein